MVSWSKSSTIQMRASQEEDKEKEDEEELDLVLGELVKIINNSEDEIHVTGRDTLYNATIRWRWIRTIDKRIEKMRNNGMGLSTTNRSYHYHVQRRLALLKTPGKLYV